MVREKLLVQIIKSTTPSNFKSNQNQHQHTTTIHTPCLNNH